MQMSKIYGGLPFHTTILPKLLLIMDGVYHSYRNKIRARSIPTSEYPRFTTVPHGFQHLLSKILADMSGLCPVGCVWPHVIQNSYKHGSTQSCNLKI